MSQNQDDVPDTLFAARLVATTKKQKGEIGLLKMYRELQERSPDKFLMTLGSLERAWMSGRGKAAEKLPVGEAAVDEGTEKCVALCEQLLKELGAG